MDGPQSADVAAAEAPVAVEAVAEEEWAPEGRKAPPMMKLA